MNEISKVLHVCGNFRVGGITTFSKSIIKLNKNFNTVHDLLFISDTKKHEIENFCKVYYLNFSNKKYFASISKAKRIYRVYNAIMIHTAHPVVILPLLFSKKQIYLFQHGMTFGYSFVMKRLLKKIWYSLLPIILNARTICSSEFAFNKAKKRGILLRKKRNVVILFGVEINDKNRRLRDIAGKKEINIGMANHLIEEKRSDLVLKSLTTYSGLKKIYLKIAGNGPHLDYLKGLTKIKRTGSVKIDFIGEVLEMDDFYDGLDLFILPSKNESFGLVVLEALTRYIPVIVFKDVGGCLSVIKDGRNGFILNNGIESLRSFWDLLNKNPEIISKQSEFLSKMDLSEYDVVTTRVRLDNLVNSSL